MRSLDSPSTPNTSTTSDRSSRASSTLYTRAPRATQTRTKQLPTAPPPTTRLTAARPPLRPRPHNNYNVLSLTATKATRSTITSVRAPKMPVGDRPRQPQLSAAAAKAVNRAPLTPKVAAKGLPVVTPLGRRTQNQTAAIAGAQGQKEDVATPPVGLYLTANITPRSGTRQSRVDSTNTTPNGTPVPDRTSDSWENSRGNIGMPALSYDGARQSQGDVAADSAESKFFYASDARNTQPVQQQRPASVPQKPATFFYANGITAEGKRTTSPPMSTPFTPVLGTMPEPAASKFFYANGTRDGPPVRPNLTTSASTSTVSSSSRMAPARPGTSSSASGLGASMPRPVSPMKSATTPMAPTLKSSAMPHGPLNRPQVAIPTTNSKRRVSIDAAPKIINGHGTSGSVSTIEAFKVPRMASPSEMSEPSSPPLSPGLSHPAMTMASLLQAVEDLGEEDDSKDEDSQPGAQSPTKSAHSTDAISELVANARRERKVQDLEITNASLEAINRTLERQLRKQTAELRRYRRLSRSGRLSIASVASSRVTSAAHTEPPTDLSDLSEEGDEFTEEEEEDSFDDSDFSSTGSASGSGRLSPSGRLTTRRQRDERRLQLDLTKHQELLIDSQKINQSLKRCLNWTEVLIKEGQKALEYNVKVSDVELGGRVLAPADEDDASHHGDDTLTTEPGLEPPLAKGVQDRDSGIELPVDGG